MDKEPTYFTHITRKFESLNGLQVLENILRDGVIYGSDKSGYIAGSQTAVCFTQLDIPDELYSFVQARDRNLHTDNCYGVMIQKAYCLSQGAIRVENKSREFINAQPAEERWKYKRKDSQVDFEWEKEWRVKGDFQLSEDYLVLVRTILEKQYLRCCFELGGMNGYLHKPRTILSFEEMIMTSQRFDPVLSGNGYVTDDMLVDVVLGLKLEGKQELLNHIIATPLPDPVLIQHALWFQKNEMSLPKEHRELARKSIRELVEMRGMSNKPNPF